jgi:hypothetical protein
LSLPTDECKPDVRPTDAFFEASLPAIAYALPQPANAGADLLEVDNTLIPVEGFTAAKTPNEKTSVVPVSGLGDDAYYFAMKDGKFMSIRVMKGSSAFSINVRGGSPSVEQIKAIEKTLAREAVDRLKIALLHHIIGR